LKNECAAKRARKFRNNIYENKRLYGIYNGIKKRCYTLKDKRYKDYGGRGIKMCESWLSSENGFDNFADWAIESGYQSNLTIDRIDVNGDYCPENCQWITLKAQSNNKRETRWVDYNGEHVQLCILCDRLGISYDTVHDRIYKRKWDVNRAIETPSERKNSLMSKCKEAGINYGTVRDRITKFGWAEEKALSTPTCGRGASSKTYGFDFGIGICKVCGKSFHKNSGKQMYCGYECRRESKSKKFQRENCTV
jgi:hypothetical protein